MTSKPEHSYGFWNESSFDVHKGCEDATFPDAILVAACEETPPEIKLAIERCFLGVEFCNATRQVQADGLILNAIFWVMRETDYTDFQGIIDSYLMIPQYLDCFRAMRDGEDHTPLEFSNFDHDEWEARYNMS